MNSTDEGVTSDSGLRMGHASITPARLKRDRQATRSIAHPQPWRPRRRRMQGRAGAEGDPAAPGRIDALRVRTRQNKARSVSSGRLSAQPWCLPERKGAAARSKDRQICVGFFGCCEAELPALAPGAMGPGGRSVGSGAPQAGPSAEPSPMQWTATLRHARNIRDPSRVLEQGPDRQRAPDGCSGGSSSMDWSLPCVVGVTIGCLAETRKGATGRRHGS